MSPVDRAGLARFPRSRLTSKPFLKFSKCSYERAGWLSSQDLRFCYRDLGKRAGNFAIWTFHPGYRDERRDEYWRSGQHRLSMPAVFFHIISIPFNCSDTASRVTEALIGPKVKILVFHHVCFVSRIWHQNSSLGSLAVSRLGNRAEISLISQGEIQPGNRISRVNRTHMKRS